MPQIALAILLGALFAFYGNQLQDPFWTSFLPLLLLLARCNPKCRFVALIAASVLWSSAILQLQLSHRLIDDFDNRIVLLSGVIADIPQLHEDRVSLLLNDLEIEGYPEPLPRKARFNWYQVKQVPLAGERWQFRVRIRQPRGLLNPAGFDYERWLFVEGIDVSGYVRRARENKRLQPAGIISLNRWRGKLASSIDRDCAQCRYTGLIKALALGMRGDIDTNTRKLLQGSGTAHLLAISGLHIGMVALLGYAIGRYCWRFGGYRCGVNRRQLASAGALILALTYSALAGFSLPTLRALLMLLVVLAGLQLNRKIDLLQSTAVALVVILIVDPLAVGSNSFWLSFGALLVIGFSSFRQPGRFSRLRQLFTLQCFFSLLFAPLALLIFDQLNPASLPANLVAIPALSFLILPMVLGASLMSALNLGDVATLLFTLVDRALDYLLVFLEWLLAVGLDSYHPVATPPILVLLVLLSLILLLVPRWSALPTIALVIMLALFGWQPERPGHGEFEITVLDVGMGSSVLLRTRHHSLVYDFGPGRKGAYNSAERFLQPLLRQQGLERPDLLVISHVDQDHSGGFHAFSESYEPSRLLSGTPRELRHRFELVHRVRNCHDYAQWHWDGVLFQFLPLPDKPMMSTNNRSCVLRVQGYHRALLPGDIEIQQEAHLVETQGDALAADILLAPHHGSKTSSSEAFVAGVSPAHVVFTLSRNNRWGFPDTGVEDRYRKHVPGLLRTDQDGAIVFSSRRDGLSVTTMRGSPGRVWRRW